MVWPWNSYELDLALNLLALWKTGKIGLDPWLWKGEARNRWLTRSSCEDLHTLGKQQFARGGWWSIYWNLWREKEGRQSKLDEVVQNFGTDNVNYINLPTQLFSEFLRWSGRHAGFMNINEDDLIMCCTKSSSITHAGSKLVFLHNSKATKMWER